MFEVFIVSNGESFNNVGFRSSFEHCFGIPFGKKALEKPCRVKGRVFRQDFA
ncbi:hypothetical protein CHCC20335_2816 [Bacillus paralicheniformis]|nr:hypothetical protein CHCC20335_2816 [Bacillus paralicheniformis]